MQKICMKCGLHNECDAAYCAECGHSFLCMNTAINMLHIVETVALGVLAISVPLLLQYRYFNLYRK